MPAQREAFVNALAFCAVAILYWMNDPFLKGLRESRTQPSAAELRRRENYRFGDDDGVFREKWDGRHICKNTECECHRNEAR